MTTTSGPEITAGQRRAIDQLNEHARQTGRFAVEASYRSLLENAVVRIWFSGIDLQASVPQEERALELSAEESVAIYIPPDFPFRVPHAIVDHRRFAGLPHVLWARELCLYASTNDWDPAAGMAGFMDRLGEFFGRILVRGGNDPVVAPWHAPVAYQGMAAPSSGIAFVIRRDAPLRTRMRRTASLTWCVGVRQGPSRVDVVDWADPRRGTRSLPIVLEELGRRASVNYPALFGRRRSPEVLLIPSIVLVEPMGFEYPLREDDLLDLLSAQGPTLPDLVDHLDLAITLNSGRDRYDRRLDNPVLLLRAPAAVGSDPGDLRASFAAWEHASDRELIAWGSVADARPEATERRDWGRPTDRLRDRSILVLGCGALGAPVAEHCVRAGARRVDVIDNGYVSPGILVRQPYSGLDVGRPKAKVLARRLRRIYPGLPVRGWHRDILEPGCLTSKRMAGYDLVIDATANRTVATKIERSRWRSKMGQPDLISLAVNQDATHGVATVTPATTTGAGVDTLRRLDLKLGDHPTGAALFHPPEGRVQFQPDGCSSPTFIGSATDLATLAAQLLDSALTGLDRPTYYVDGNGTAELVATKRSAHVVRLGRDEPCVARVRVDFAHDRILGRSAGFQIRAEPHALEEIRGYLQKANTEGPTVPETGGIILGRFDEASGVLWVSEVTGPPSDSIGSSLLFQPNLDAAREHVQSRLEHTFGQVGFVGFWHSHPHGSAQPSKLDRQTMGEVITSGLDPPQRALMLVVGLNGKRDDSASAIERWAPDLHIEVFER